MKPAAALAAALLALAVAAAAASSTGYCDAPRPLSAADHDKLLRVAAIVRAELQASGARAALVSRSGLDLGWLGHRYSHAGVALRHSPELPWSVRQLYFACDEQRPRLFDQGLAAFVLGGHEPDRGHVSVLLLPDEPGRALESRALDARRSLDLLGEHYSANAHAYSVRYQNCNQWLAELLASAWGDVPPGADARRQAQRWLMDQGYEPSVFDVGWRPLMWLSTRLAWLHADDHPDEDLDALRYRVSMPAAIEAFVQRRVPGSRRLEFCHLGPRVVIRRGWEPIAEGCEPGPEDTVITL